LTRKETIIITIPMSVARDSVAAGGIDIIKRSREDAQHAMTAKKNILSTQERKDRMMSSVVENIPGYEHLSGIQLINKVVEDYNPKYVIAMFSGGHDSVTATHIASQHPRVDFAAHINTGIGIEQTRDFVRNTCSEWGIELKEYFAEKYVRGDGIPDPQTYEDLVMGYGFPGPAKHLKMYNRLKEKPWRQLHRELKRDREHKVMYVSGVRKQESKLRKKRVTQLQIWEGTKLIVAPIWDFSKTKVGKYMADNNLKRNPVVDMLHMSGECLCGAYAKPGELEELRDWGFDEVVAQIEGLEKKVMKLHPWKWGSGGPPEWVKQAAEGQLGMEGIAPDNYPEFLCTSCAFSHMGEKG
jgi:3'-phosphoadenosine 5'-phosphosulfate sulfotransferase (PAPS reductase)/FAD synthetase